MTITALNTRINSLVKKKKKTDYDTKIGNIGKRKSLIMIMLISILIPENLINYYHRNLKKD